MNGTRAWNVIPAQGVPADLLVLRSRLADAGVQLRLPTAGPGYRLPAPFEVQGESLSATVVRLRGGDAGA
jgi:hypothetical protein